MRLDTLELRSFRNYERESFAFGPGINVITGRNAQGKTNLLEAISLLTGARALRARYDREMIRFDTPEARVCAIIEAGGRAQKIDITLRCGQRRRIERNGIKTAPAELAGQFMAVIFLPGDLDIVRAGPADRRRYMDNALCQLRPGYAQLLARYNRLLEHKMAILRDAAEKPSLLAPLDEFSEQMAAAAARLIRYRAAFVRRAAEGAAAVQREFSSGSEELVLTYRTISSVTDPCAPASEIYGQVMEHQRAHRTAELNAKSCLTGIHRDDIDITLNGQSARQFASQGQTRTAALAMKIAERDIFFAETGEQPLLLLDDVLSELDSRRQEFVLNRLGGGQVFITCCEDEGISDRCGGRVLTIDGGKLA